MGIVTAITNLIGILNGPFVIAVFTAFLILGVIAYFQESHSHTWKYVFNVCLYGGICAGAAAILQQILV